MKTNTKRHNFCHTLDKQSHFYSRTRATRKTNDQHSPLTKMPTIKGTASVSDSRAREKALKKTKFPRSFGKSVSLEKVNKSVLEQWIEQKVTSILGFEDEIVSSTAINLFLPSDNSDPDPKKAQLDLAGKSPLE